MIRGQSRALSKLETGEAGVFLYTIPIFAMLLSAVFLGEIITWTNNRRRCSGDLRHLSD